MAGLVNHSVDLSELELKTKETKEETGMQTRRSSVATDKATGEG